MDIHPALFFPTRRWRAGFAAALALVALGLIVPACAPAPETAESEAAAADSDSDSDTALVVYSGRSKGLIDPILQRFEEASDVDVEIRYGDTGELAATLLEEGERTPCDVFIAQDAAALGALAAAGVLRPLPDEIRALLPARFAAPGGEWVGLSGRARTVVYNPERVRPEDLPRTLDEVTDPRYRGRFGIAPANASFQAHMALYRALRGDEAADALLDGIAANEPLQYPKNSAIVEATTRGEIDWGLVNHYYLWRALSEDPDAPGRNYAMPGDGVSSFINLAGAGVLSDHPAALELLRFLLGAEAQRYFAEETHEYPLAAGVEARAELDPLSSFAPPEVDFAQVSDALKPTAEAIAARFLR